MKCKWRRESCILAALMIAGSYAIATTCYKTSNSATCFASGASVDQITWANPAHGTVDVLANGDWTLTTGAIFTGIEGTGAPTYNTYTPPACSGPAKFTDPNTHNQTIGYWENGVASLGGTPVPSTPVGGVAWGTTTGISTTCN